MLVHEVQGARISWDPELRLLCGRFDERWSPTATGAEELRRTLRAWTGASEPYRMLADCGHVTRIPVVWQLEWAAHFREDRHRMKLAVLDLPLVMLPILEMVRATSGASIRTFRSETEALAWLFQDPVAAEARGKVLTPGNRRARSSLAHR